MDGNVEFLQKDKISRRNNGSSFGAVTSELDISSYD